MVESQKGIFLTFLGFLARVTRAVGDSARLNLLSVNHEVIVHRPLDGIFQTVNFLIGRF